MQTYGIILAGGEGNRLWPISRKSKPKQFLRLDGENSMIVNTINRIKSFIPKKNIFIITCDSQYQQMKKELKNIINYKNILVEPEARNTSACIGYATMEITSRFGDGIICVFSSDHHISKKIKFKKNLLKCIKLARKSDDLILLGIKSSFPATSYGYIELGKKLKDDSYEVISFIEKPILKLAKEYILTNKYVWNSGIFIFKTKTILENFKNLLPQTYDIFQQIYENKNDRKRKLKKYYKNIPKISIDYGIMEKANNLKVVISDFNWMDFGTFENIIHFSENKNHIIGTNICYKTKNCLIYTEDKKVLTSGISNLIIVSVDDMLLICNKKNINDIKKFKSKI